MTVLSKRMKSVVSLLTPGLFVTDIGCDHAYVSIYLAENKIASGVLAMDVRPGPLEIARRNIAAAGLTDVVKTRLSDGGRELLRGEAEAAIIAGMGGMLIEHILSDSAETFKEMKELILAPQSDLFHFRRFLYENSYAIVDEDMVFEDGKYYPMMRVLPENSKLWQVEKMVEAKACPGDVQLCYGPCLLKKRNQVLFDFLRYERLKKEEILRSLEDSLTPDNERMAGRIDELKKELLLNEKAMKYYQ